tara:strand:- start:2744 stop:4420 length:1677 start_codon:yes stop_codon:yes gene_type:complete
MGKYQDELRLDIQANQQKQRDISGRALEEFEKTGGFSRPPALRDIDKRFQNITSFLPEGQRSNIGMMNYQGTPGQMYVNAPDVAPGTQFGTDLYPPPPPRKAPVVVTPPPDDDEEEEPLDEQLIAINEKMKGQGLPEFKTMQEFYDYVADQTEGGPPILPPYMLANEGGLASLPQGFFGGGEADGTSDEDQERQNEDIIADVQRGFFGGIGRAGRQQRRANRRSMRQQRRGDRQMLRMANRAHQPMSTGSNLGSYAPLTPNEGGPLTPGQGGEEAGKKPFRIGDNLRKLKKFRRRVADKKADLIDQGLEAAGMEDRNRQRVKAGMRVLPGFFGDRISLIEDFRKQRQEGASFGEPAMNFFKTIFGKNEGGIVGLHGFSNGDYVDYAQLIRPQNAADDLRKSIGSGLDGSMSGGSGLEALSKEELIRMIESMGGGTSKGNMGNQLGSDLKTIGQGIGKLFGGGAGGPTAAANGGLMYLAQGDMVEDFPRMNGQISGPGTERSDDIPAMLSDGEFVVNAKAVRGIGNIGGANGDKEDQRREGARMMYALQQAGEEAARRT